MIRSQPTKFIVLHCSATPPDRDIGAADIDAMHKTRGWGGIGYHFVIRRDGKVEAGRHLYEVGAHVVGYNAVSVAVCLVGGVAKDGKTSENNFTEQQWVSLKDTVNVLKKMFTDAQIVGHRDLSPDVDNDGIVEPWEWLKDCPCFSVEQWVASSFTPQKGLGKVDVKVKAKKVG